VAKRLNVTPAQLRSAVKGALLDRLQAAVAAGRLTQAQANRIKQRIERGALPIWLLAGPRGFERRRFGLLGPRGFGPPGPLGAPAPPGLAPPGFPPPRGRRLLGRAIALGPFRAAAKYLGISDAQLVKDLRGGKSLAQVAAANGKSVSGLEQALDASMRTRLDRAVAAGFITKAQEQRMLKRLSTVVARMVGAHWPVQGRPGLRPVPGPAVAPAPLGAGPPPPTA